MVRNFVAHTNWNVNWVTRMVYYYKVSGGQLLCIPGLV